MSVQQSQQKVNLRLLCPQYEKEIQFQVSHDIKLTQVTEYFAEMFDKPGTKLQYRQQLTTSPIDQNITVKDLIRISVVKDNTIELFVSAVKKSKKDNVCCEIY